MRTDRLWRLFARASLGALVLLFAVLVLVLVFDPPYFQPGQIGIDYHFYRGAASDWLAHGTFYLPHQLAGPYPIRYLHAADVLYPPVALYLFVPFVLLPAWTWWAIPMGLTVAALWWLRPATWTWPVMLVLALWPWTPGIYLQGNPGMWIIAFEALGLIVAGPAVLVLIKPSLAPFALPGVRRRAWWVALALFTVACLPFGTLWLDWWRAAVVNPTNGGLLYSLTSVPSMVLPLVAWLGSTRRRRASVSGTSGESAPTSGTRLRFDDQRDDGLGRYVSAYGRDAGSPRRPADDALDRHLQPHHIPGG